MRGPLFEAAGDGNQGGGDGAGAGTNSGAAAFDPVAFETKILGEIDTRLNKTINGFGKAFKNDFQKMIEGLKPAANAGAGAGSGAGAGEGAGTGEGAGAGKPADPQVNALQLELKKIREQSEARIKALEDENTTNKQKAEEMARDKALGEALGKFEFITPEARNTAAQLLRNAIQRTDDGEFVAGDLPLDKYVETELPSKHAYLLKGKDVSGANARPGKAGGGKKWDLESVLRPENFSKLTPAEQAEVRQAVAASL